MSTSASVLSSEEHQHFLEKGYLKVEACFSREAALSLTDFAYKRLGYDPKDPSTWKESRIHMPVMQRNDVKVFAPKAYAAICGLMGGEERIRTPVQWGDGFIFNFHEGADQPWSPPSSERGGWHKDGDFFRHFLDSPEQGLLTIILWSDIEHQGGGTYLAPDSISLVARALNEHPEGVHPERFKFGKLVKDCREFVEATGRVGDVYLIHPYMLHSKSQNLSGRPRIISNPPVHLKESMDFNRPDAKDFSPVERVVLKGLGMERLPFRPSGPREEVIPQRIVRQRKMLEEEKIRLANSG